jgi:hypothetical protein
LHLARFFGTFMSDSWSRTEQHRPNCRTDATFVQVHLQKYAIDACGDIGSLVSATYVVLYKLYHAAYSRDKLVFGKLFPAKGYRNTLKTSMTPVGASYF